MRNSCSCLVDADTHMDWVLILTDVLLDQTAHLQNFEMFTAVLG